MKREFEILQRNQPRMTPNGRIKGFLTRPFGVIRGWFSPEDP